MERWRWRDGAMERWREKKKWRNEEIWREMKKWRINRERDKD
jgi:hypothetical protein